MHPGEVILANLRRTLRLDQTLELLNVYKGVPVLYPAGVARLGEAELEIFFDRPEAVCLALERHTTLMNASLDEPVAAAVLDVDLPAGTARLGQLRAAESHLGERMILRVEPAGPVAAVLTSAGGPAAATLVDLSMNGAGLHLTADAGLRPGTAVRLEAGLPDLALRLTGTVRYARPAADGWRAGVTFVPGRQAGDLLAYLRQRHDQILAELPGAFAARAGS